MSNTSAVATRLKPVDIGKPRMRGWLHVYAFFIAIVAGIFGFTGVSEASASIAKVLFCIFLVLFIGAVAIGVFLGSKLMS